MDDNCGFDELGAFDIKALLKKEGPQLAAAVSEELSKDDKKAIVPSDGKGKGKGKGEANWLVRPVLGPLPGAVVVVGGVGILGALGYAFKRILSR